MAIKLNDEWMSRGIRLRKAREAKGLYLKDIAKILNKSISAICDYEKGRKKVSFDDLKTLCIFYDIDIRTF